MSAFSFHTFRNNRNNANLSLFTQFTKAQQKVQMKISQRYQSMGPEYVSGKINSCILELLLRRFCSLVFTLSWKS